MSRRGALIAWWAAALTLAAVFASLGFWQSGRAVQKERMLADAGQVLSSPSPGPLSAAQDPQRAATYDWAQGRGRFLPTPPLLLDNQQREGRVGVRAYALFQPEAQPSVPLLVDLGWLPLQGDRALPTVEVPRGNVDVRGLLAAPPSSGLAIGAPLVRRDEAWLMLRVEPAAIGEALGLDSAPAPRVLRLDPELPFGYPRDLALLTNTLSPDKHRGYALQWFGLAATVLVIAVVLTLRRSRS